MQPSDVAAHPELSGEHKCGQSLKVKESVNAFSSGCCQIVKHFCWRAPQCLHANAPLACRPFPSARSTRGEGNCGCCVWLTVVNHPRGCAAQRSLPPPHNNIC